MLAVRGLSSGFGESTIVRDVDLDLHPGEVMTLMGSNGVGKTTLLRTLLGLLKAKTGSILFKGRNITTAPTDQRVRAGIGYVPQGREIFPFLTVRENLLLAVESRGGNGREQALREAYALFPGLEPIDGRRGGNLSGGQQQQVAIARAILTRPELLILDEPTEGIQPSIVKDIGRAIRHLNGDRGMSILLVEQYVDFALDLADRYGVMEQGRIAREGDVTEESRASIRAAVRI
jgi:urea transport system ATP-binding protein